MEKPLGIAGLELFHGEHAQGYFYVLSSQSIISQLYMSETRLFKGTTSTTSSALNTMELRFRHLFHKALLGRVTMVIH